MSELRLTCGNCIYWEEQTNPKTGNPGGRGFCFGSVPTVILMPGEMSRVAMGNQGQPLNFIPQMLRPVTSKDERFCGMYSPDIETQELLTQKQEEMSSAETMDQDS